MKRYILTDQEGNTPSGCQLTPGKVIHAADDHEDPMVVIINAASRSPELAVLLSPQAGNSEVTMYMLKTWNVGTQAYTVVKKDEVPDIPAKMHFKFALAVMDSVFDSAEFSNWASEWNSGNCQDEAAIDAVIKILERERGDIKALEEIAAMAAAAGSEAQTQMQKENIERAFILLDAAKTLLSSSAENEQLNQDIAQVVKDISESIKEEELLDISKKVIEVVEESLEAEC